MEYASGGELFEHICNVGRLEEEKVIMILFYAVRVVLHVAQMPA